MNPAVLLKAFSEHPSYAQGSLQVRSALRPTLKGFNIEISVEDPERVLLDFWNQAQDDFARRDGLWKSTCFEAFWGLPNSASYYELNFNRWSQWNIYRFDAYRSPQPPKAAADFVVTQIRRAGNNLTASIEGDLAFPCGYSLCAVASLKAGDSPIYLSQSHAGPKPDFHLRESFTLKVESKS